MSQVDDNQQAQEQPEETPAPDGLMAAAALAEDTANDDEQSSIPHLAEDAQPVEGEDEDEIYERPDWFPAKHWDEKEGPDIEGLVKSNLELEKKFHHGDHKAPEDGNYDMSALTEAGYETDDPVVEGYLEWAKKHGINQAAFSELVETVTVISGEAGIEMKANLEAEKQALGANADAIIQSNIEWADGMLRKGVISEEEREELNIWGGTALGQRMMQKVRQMTGDLSKLPIADVAEAGQSKDEFDAEMQTLIADPRYRNDANFRRQVEQRFEKRYG